MSPIWNYAPIDPFILKSENGPCMRLHRGCALGRTNLVSATQKIRHQGYGSYSKLLVAWEPASHAWRVNLFPLTARARSSERLSSNRRPSLRSLVWTLVAIPWTPLTRVTNVPPCRSWSISSFCRHWPSGSAPFRLSTVATRQLLSRLSAQKSEQFKPADVASAESSIDYIPPATEEPICFWSHFPDISWT